MTPINKQYHLRACLQPMTPCKKNDVNLVGRRSDLRVIDEPKSNEKPFVHDRQENCPIRHCVRRQWPRGMWVAQCRQRDGGRGIDARVRKVGGKGAERTYSLLRTRARGAASPTPMTKLMILDTRVSNPAMMKSPPKSVEPT